MGITATSRARDAAIFVCVFGASCTSAAWAQEYCVACLGPDAVYRCAFDNAAPTGMPLKLLCTSTLARQGGHTSCSIKGGTVFECDAPIRRIDATVAANALRSPADSSPDQPRGADPAAAATAGRETIKPASAPPGRSAPIPAKAKPESSPQTVEQLAKDVTRSSKESLGKAGDTIGATARKAWDCLKSFLKSC